MGLRAPPHLAYNELHPNSDVTSDQSLIYFSIYDRDVDGEAFIGRVEVKPTLVHDHTVDRWLSCVALFLLFLSSPTANGLTDVWIFFMS